MSRLIGIDIGSRYTKVVQIEPKAKPCLVNAFFFPTPYSTSEPHSRLKPINAEEFFNQIVPHISLKDLQASRIGINIPSSLITVLVINLPKMSKKELDIAVISEAKRKMIPPYQLNHTFEYLILREIILAKIPRYETLVVRTDKDYIQEVLSIFSVFKEVQPVLITLSPYVTVSYTHLTLPTKA